MIVLPRQRKTLQANWIDTGLFAAADVYNNSTGTPVFVTRLTMSEYLPGMYQASMIPAAGVSYLVAMRVFTDNGYTMPDSNYAPASTDFECADLRQKVPVRSMEAIADAVPNVVAIVND